MTKVSERDRAVLKLLDALDSEERDYFVLQTVLANDEGKHGVFDASVGSFVILQEYDEIKKTVYHEVHNNYWLRKGDRYTLVQIRGGVMVVLISECADYEAFDEKSSSEDRYYVIKNGKRGVYALKSCSFLIDHSAYDYVQKVTSTKHEGGSTSVDYMGGLYYVTQAGKRGIYSTHKGCCVVPVEYGHVYHPGGGSEVFVVECNGKRGVYSTKESGLIVPVEFSSVIKHPTDKDVWIVRSLDAPAAGFYEPDKENTYGLYNAKLQKLVIPMEYYYEGHLRYGFSHASDGCIVLVDDEYFVVKRNVVTAEDGSGSCHDLCGIYNVTKETLSIPTKYERLYKWGEFFVGSHGDMKDLYDADGILRLSTPFWPKDAYSQRFVGMTTSDSLSGVLDLKTWQLHVIPELKHAWVRAISDTLLMATNFGTRSVLVSFADDKPVILRDYQVVEEVE